jgi:hypothetical protein
MLDAEKALSGKVNFAEVDDDKVHVRFCESSAARVTTGRLNRAFNLYFLEARYGQLPLCRLSAGTINGCITLK